MLRNNVCSLNVALICYIQMTFESMTMIVIIIMTQTELIINLIRMHSLCIIGMHRRQAERYLPAADITCCSNKTN